MEATRSSRAPARRQPCDSKQKHSWYRCQSRLRTAATTTSTTTTTTKKKKQKLQNRHIHPRGRCPVLVLEGLLQAGRLGLGSIAASRGKIQLLGTVFVLALAKRFVKSALYCCSIRVPMGRRKLQHTVHVLAHACHMLAHACAPVQCRCSNMFLPGAKPEPSRHRNRQSSPLWSSSLAPAVRRPIHLEEVEEGSQLRKSGLCRSFCW